MTLYQLLKIKKVTWPHTSNETVKSALGPIWSGTFVAPVARNKLAPPYFSVYIFLQNG